MTMTGYGNGCVGGDGSGSCDNDSDSIVLLVVVVIIAMSTASRKHIIVLPTESACGEELFSCSINIIS